MAASSDPKKHVLFVCGSLRTRSLNRQVGEKAASLMEDAVRTSWLCYADLPFFDQDAEFPAPGAVARVRSEVRGADAVWICSPEYNHNIPGVLKNCLDWLSRPLEKGQKETALTGKLVTWTCAAGGSHGRFVSAALAETLSLLTEDLLWAAHTQVGLDRHDYTTDELVLAPEEEAALEAQVRILLERLG